MLPALRITDVLQRVDTDLYGAYVVSTDPEPGLDAATVALLPAVGRFTALRNLLYALEWWVFGAFAAFIWWRHLRDQLAAEALAGAVADADLGAVNAALTRYRVMAIIVGILLVVLCSSDCPCTTATCCSPTRCPRAARPSRSAPTSRSTSASRTAGST